MEGSKSVVPLKVATQVDGVVQMTHGMLAFIGWAMAIRAYNGGF